MAKGNMTIRMEPELKAQAAALFKSLGMDLSTATGIFYRQALRCHGLPFEVKVDEPNAVTYAAMEAAERACQMDPSNQQYRQLYAQMQSGRTRYQSMQSPFGGGGSNFCCQLILCNMCLGGGCCPGIYLCR